MTTGNGSKSDALDALSAEDREVALRSAYWIDKSAEVYPQSVSLAYAALVFALETLLEDEKHPGMCESCGQMIYEKSIKRRFRALFDAYAPDATEEDVRPFYDIRCDVVHGRSLMPQDKAEPPHNFEHDAAYNRLRHLSIEVLENWVRGKSKS